MNKYKLVYILSGSIIILIILCAILFLKMDAGTGNSTEENIETNQNGEGISTENDISETTPYVDPFLNSESITEMLLTVNEYSRPGKKLNKVKGIVIHYVGNPNTTAVNNRNYFENLKDTKERSASSHYIIGLEGEIIQCIPLNEIAYASNNRNKDTIAIECCHPDKSGKFNSMTYDSLVELTAALCNTYNLDPTKDVIRHYDVTGKLCPLYFVENEDEWQYFLMQVNSKIKISK